MTEEFYVFEKNNTYRVTPDGVTSAKHLDAELLAEAERDVDRYFSGELDD